jgi:hypothetical protein
MVPYTLSSKSVRTAVMAARDRDRSQSGYLFLVNRRPFLVFRLIQEPSDCFYPWWTVLTVRVSLMDWTDSGDNDEGNCDKVDVDC